MCVAIPFSVVISSLKTRQLGSWDGPCGRSEWSHLLAYWISSHMVSEESTGRKDSVYDCLGSFLWFSVVSARHSFTLSLSSHCVCPLWTHFLHWWGPTMMQSGFFFFFLINQLQRLQWQIDELENSLLRGFSNQSFSLCIEWRMFRDSCVMLVGSGQFTLDHSSPLDSGKKKKTGYNWFGCFLVINGSLEVTFQLFPRSEECSSNMICSNQWNYCKWTHRAHMHDFTCPLRSSYAVIPSDHQSTEKE